MSGPDLDRYLSVRTASAGAHTADCSRVAFLTDVTGTAQLWSVPAGGGWPDQASFGGDRVLGLLPSAGDPRVVAFARDEGGNERAQLHVVAPDGTGERALSVDPDAIHRLGAFTPDGRWLLYCANNRDGVDFDLYRTAADGSGEAELIAKLDGWTSVADITPAGGHVLISLARSNVDSDLLLVELASGEVELLTPHEGEVRHLPGAITDDALYLTSDAEGGFLRAYRVDLATGEWRVIDDGDWDVEALAVRGRTGALGRNVDGMSRLELFDPATLVRSGEVDVPTGVIRDLAIAPDGQTLSWTLSGPRHNDDVWVSDDRGQRPRRLTRSSTAGLSPESFAEPDLVRVTSFDGLEVPAWVYRPGDRVDDARGPVPVVVSVHGGPEAQARPSFNAVQQYLVARGYAVVVPNVRGSTGYGRHYESLDDRRRRMDAVADLAAVGRWAGSQQDLDAGRIALMGGSYGGFMVLAAMSSYPELWAAGVDIVGIANFVTFLERTGAYRRALREREYGTLEEDRDFLAAISPIAHVDRIIAPLLVIHGANDPRVPLAEAEQVVARLRELGRVVESIVFDDEGHGISKLANRRVAFGAAAQFLDRHAGRA